MLDELKPDVVFLDISMPGGSGFEMLDQIRERPFEVVLTSAYEEHAINAFDYQVFNYLLKPIEESKLSQVVERLVTHFRTTPSSPPQISTEDNLYINTHKGHQLVEIGKILRCEADGGYTYFFLEGGAKYMSSQHIKVYERELKSYGFCRIHKKHLVNLKKVKYFTKGKGGHVTLSDGTEVSISYRQKSSFLQALQRKVAAK
jgi:two-component system LytT family response regulator